MRLHGPVFLAKRLFRPVFYQGPARRRRRGYFEGWYFKSAFPAAATVRAGAGETPARGTARSAENQAAGGGPGAGEGTALAVIPGISLARGDPHAFIQTLTGRTSHYHRFPVDSFHYGTREFQIEVGENLFSLSTMRLRIPGLHADLSIVSDVRWPSSPLSPNSMGWYAYMRFMECYHGIIVVDGTVEGEVNGRRITDGRFYLEKDWGASFPRGWIWLQCNSFPNRASITCSVARVPFRRRVFTGFIAALWDGKALHRFATYTGARIEALEIYESSVRLVLADTHKRLSIRAARPGASVTGGELISPVDGAMEGRIAESIDATVEARLEVDGHPVFSATGRNAGLEVVHPEELPSTQTS